MKILEVVMGSNHFLIQPQTVGKKDGAPMIYTVSFDVYIPDGPPCYKGRLQIFYPVSLGNVQLPR